MAAFCISTAIGAAADDCFLMSLSVDAHTQSMEGSRERIVAGVTSGTMALGDVVTWRAVHFGLPFRMTSKITAYERPHRFVDEQVKGPFSHWWHEHVFTPTPAGTMIFDNVRYAAPLGPLGSAVDKIALERYMRRLLNQRNVWLKQELEAGGR
jgi:ligand-binding SRPBCC domain-containing protein